MKSNKTSDGNTIFINEKNDVLDYWNYGRHQGIYVIKITSSDQKERYYVGKSFNDIKKRIYVHNWQIKRQRKGIKNTEPIYVAANKAISIEVVKVIKTNYFGDYGKFLLHQHELALIKEFKQKGYCLLNESNDWAWQSNKGGKEMKSILDEIKEKEGIDLGINKNLQEIMKNKIDENEKSSDENNNDDWRNNFFD